MKDQSQRSLEADRPNVPALDCVNFCLKQLYRDETKRMTDEVVHHLTFEELIGALLAARDKLEATEEDEDE